MVLLDNNFSDCGGNTEGLQASELCHEGAEQLFMARQAGLPGAEALLGLA